MLRRQDVGHRIVVRRIVGVRDGRTLFSDALGELVELNETHLTLATAQGRLRVPHSEVHRAKRVPAARRPTASAMTTLELAANEAWPAPDTDRLGDWLLRSADGWTGRANSALPVGDPDRPLPAAIDAVQDWYASRGRPAQINTPLPLASPVGAELDTRGWTASPLVLVQTMPVAALRDAVPADTGLPPVRLTPAPSDGWITLAAGRKGGFPPAARHVLTAVGQVRFAEAYVGDELVAIARGSVTGAGRWLGLSLVEVVEGARRRGLGRHLIGALAEWGGRSGATNAFLQVEQRNTAAAGLYRALGFHTHHTYLTRRAPDA